MPLPTVLRIEKSGAGAMNVRTNAAGLCFWQLDSLMTGVGMMSFSEKTFIRMIHWIYQPILGDCDVELQDSASDCEGQAAGDGR